MPSEAKIEYMKELLKIFKKARTRLKKGGWIKGNFAKKGRYFYNPGDGEGFNTATHYCALGALIREGYIHSKTTRWPTLFPIRLVLDEDTTEVSFYGLAGWNDKQKSKEAVIKGFDMAIKKLREKLKDAKP